ncbi:MAG: 3-oxoacyl-ACP synthase III family protein [Gemmatimonadales bacterium]
MSTLRVSSLATYLPSGSVDNAHFSRITGRDPSWFESRTGIQTRRRASPSENTNTMAIAAARELLSLEPSLAGEVDLIIGCTYTPWDTVGTLAHAVQRDLGIIQARAFQLSSACSSVMNAFEIVAAMVESGRSHVALVVAAEHNSGYADDGDQNAGHLWGDGAAAAVLRGGGPGRLEVVDVATAGLANVGRGCEGVHLRPLEDGLVMPFGRDVFTTACEEMEAQARGMLDRNGLAPADLRLLVPHQANQRIHDRLAVALALDPCRVASTMASLGNTGCASTLITLHNQLQFLDAGDYVLLVTFGGGYSAGCALLRCH